MRSTYINKVHVVVSVHVKVVAGARGNIRNPIPNRRRVDDKERDLKPRLEAEKVVDARVCEVEMTELLLQL